MKKKEQHIILDLDGTIINSKQEILKTYLLVFSKVKPATEPVIEGLNYAATINEVLKGVYKNEIEKIAAAKSLFSSVYDNSDYAETDLYPGVIETLNFLKVEGHTLYIATNKRLAPTARIIEKKGMAQFFSDVMANEMTPGVTLSKQQMLEGLKNKYSFSEGYFVGDSEMDIKAGKLANLRTIAVTYGYESREQLVQQRPDYLLESFKELINFVGK